MRIGTWNLDGRWSTNHFQFLQEEACDIWLLTEVPMAFALDGGALHRSAFMTATKSWAAVWSKGAAVPSPSPHSAAATVVVDGVLLCSCVLPWRSAREERRAAHEVRGARRVLGGLQRISVTLRP